MADVNIAGPARQLSRVRDRGATLARAEGIFGNEGPAIAVCLVFAYADNGERLAIVADAGAWSEIKQRGDRAFVPVDLPGQMRLL